MVNTRKKSYVPPTEGEIAAQEAEQAAEQSDSSIASTSTRRSTRRSIGGIASVKEVLTPTRRSRRLSNSSVESLCTADTPNPVGPLARRSIRNKKGAGSDSEDVELLTIKKRKLVDEGLEPISEEKNETDKIVAKVEKVEHQVIDLEDDYEETKTEGDSQSQEKTESNPEIIEITSESDASQMSVVPAIADKIETQEDDITPTEETFKLQVDEMSDKGEENEKVEPAVTPTGTPEIFYDIIEEAVKPTESAESIEEVVKRTESVKVAEEVKDTTEVAEKADNQKQPEVEKESKEKASLSEPVKDAVLLDQEKEVSSPVKELMEETNITPLALSPEKVPVQADITKNPAEDKEMVCENVEKSVSTQQLEKPIEMETSYTESPNKEVATTKAAPSQKSKRVKKKKAKTENSAVSTQAKGPLPCGAEVMKTIPRGKSVSGREWKDPKSNPRYLFKDRGLKMPLAKITQLRQERKHILELQNRLKEEERERREEMKARRELNKKRQEENARRSEIVQVIRNPNKLKRMKKKELRSIQKRDTSAIV